MGWLHALRSPPASSKVAGSRSSSLHASAPGRRSSTTLVSQASSAAERWENAVAVGDAPTAWALLGPQSRQSVGGQAGFDHTLAASLSATWARWATTRSPQVNVIPLAASGGLHTWAVLFREPTNESGGVPASAVSLAVRTGSQGLQVEPFVPGPALDLIDLPPGNAAPTLPSTTPIPVRIDAADPVVAIDGTAEPPASLKRGAHGTVIQVAPDPAPTPGLHVVTVGYLTADGNIVLDSVLFRAT